MLTKTIVILTPSRYSAPRGHVSYDPTLASKFDLIREPDETVSWVGRPHFVPYLISGLPVFAIGCLWLTFDINLMRGMHREQLGFAVPFFALHLFPFWGSLLYMLWLLLSFHNVMYAITNKRLLLRGGAFGASFKSYDLKQLSAIEVSQGPFEKSVGAGSVRFTYGFTTSRQGTPMPRQERFRAVDDPYAVYRQVNETAEKASPKAAAQPAGS